MFTKRQQLALIMFTITILVTIQPSTIEGNSTINIQPHVSSSCTIFTATSGERVLFGNNEDYKSNNAYRWYIPAQNVSTTYFGIKEIYGSVFFGFDNNDNSETDGWEQGGMNEYGLCYDANGLPDIQLNLNPTAQFPYTTHAFAQVLWDCKTVVEVIDWFENHKWSGYLGAQFHYADKTGDAVVVGVNSTGQWVFTRINDNFMVSTNFDLNDVTHGSYPCQRYETATNMLRAVEYEEDLNISYCADLLYNVHQKGVYSTKYSNICDPVNLEFYFNSGEDFSVQNKYNLTAILADKSSYVQKDSFFGVEGVEEGVLVKTEKIDIIFETTTTTEKTEFNISYAICFFTLLLFVKIFSFKGKRKNP